MIRGVNGFMTKIDPLGYLQSFWVFDILVNVKHVNRFADLNLTINLHYILLIILTLLPATTYCVI